jgi:hypothetical protein
MNELLVVFYILATLAVAYLWIYPKFIGNNLSLMAWVDAVVTAIPILISAVLFWESDPTFRFLFAFDMNWFFYTLFALVIIEIPIFLLYLKARGLSKEYWSYLKRSTSLEGLTGGSISTASVKEVEKSLNDTRWDGLRSIRAKRVLLWGSNILILFGTGFLVGVGDNLWAIYSLIHILIIFAFWFLLRTSTRLVADAPDEALDEMLISRRDRAHVLAFRFFAAVTFTAGTALMTFAVVTDFQSDSDGFTYLLELTWPQVQAIFWAIFAYGTMLPSMAMLFLDIKREKGKNAKG